MKMGYTFFQSYLIVGDRPAQQAKIQEIGTKFGIDISKKSPDIQIITPQKEAIGIEEIRSLKKNIYQKPVSGTVKLVLIEDAQNLTQEAQNSFLKLLEEPPQHTVLILTSSSQKSFLPTIISRVTTIQVGFKVIDTKNTQELDLQNLLSFFIMHPHPQKLLEEEIISFVSRLKEKVANGASRQEIIDTIETIKKLQKARQMIAANVNANQVLIALAISLKSKNFSL